MALTRLLTVCATIGPLPTGVSGNSMTNSSPPKARHGLGAGKVAAAQDRANTLDDTIAHDVTVGIVHLLEVVDVEHHDAVLG